MSNLSSNLDLISGSAVGQQAKVNALSDAGSPATLFGRRASTCLGLVWGYYGGIKAIKGVPTVIANGTITLAASSTNYVYEDQGVVAFVTAAPTGWPGQLDGNKRALYQIVTGTSTVSDYLDYRSSGSGERQAPRIGTIAYGATVTLDWDKYDVIRIVLTGNCTFNHSGGENGSRKYLEVTQDSTGSRIGTWGTGSHFSATIPSPTLTTTGTKMDRLEWVRRDSNYDLVAINKGF